MYIYGFDTGGKPKGYFLDTIGIYSVIFSPILFLYFAYSIYRGLIEKERGIIFFIAITALLFSLLLSLRQKIRLEDFAPFVIIASPLMVKIFFMSYRVRLKQFRFKYKFFLSLVFILLIINSLLMIFSKSLYQFLDNPKKNFAYKFHNAKELAIDLKQLKDTTINIEDEKMKLRLRYYNVKF